MLTQKQDELLTSYLSTLPDDLRPLYRGIAMYLCELGYTPHKQRSYIVFKHDLHNKQMAKMGIRGSKITSPYLALRFSACKGYSQRFADIVSANIINNPNKTPGCMTGKCSFCSGEPVTHVYSYTFPDGGSGYHCGAYALEIPDIKADDLDEIKKLIKEEHEYLIKHEANKD